MKRLLEHKNRIIMWALYIAGSVFVVFMLGVIGDFMFSCLNIAEYRYNNRSSGGYPIGSCVTVSSPSRAIDGHDYVNLGLSVKWATCNIGASSPEDRGDWYRWAETLTVKSDHRFTLFDERRRSLGNITGNVEYDAARANWGENWRMPTNKEWIDLIIMCYWKWCTLNDVPGYKVTSKLNGKSIFLPATFSADGVGGHYGIFADYWSSIGGYYLYFEGGGCRFIKADYRYDNGRSIRPVTD